MAAFSTKTYGKWILAGEHVVIRGGTALVFPYYDRSLTLEFTPGGQGLVCEFSGEYGEELRLLFWGVMEKALAAVGRSRENVTGQFYLNSSVPVGAGLGASATLCAAVARWLEWQTWITSERVPEFARELENLFHGESSGVDIAVALSGQPLEFRRGMKPQILRPLWQPKLFISYSGIRGLTSECVRKVQNIIETDPSKGTQLDTRMSAAVEKAKRALLSREDAMTKLHLSQAINEACACFMSWDLTQGALNDHMTHLRTAGAIAAKPTGSGQGGYVISLWEQTPPADLGLAPLLLQLPATKTSRPSSVDLIGPAAVR